MRRASSPSRPDWLRRWSISTTARVARRSITTLKPSLVEALKGDVPYLKSIGDFAELDVPGFVQDAPLRAAFAARNQDYGKAVAATANPSVLGGTDPVCNTPVNDPARASELWLDGHPTAHSRRLPDVPAQGRSRRDRQGREGPCRVRSRLRAGHQVVRRQVGVGA